MAAIERFVASVRQEEAALDRMLSTVLFTDVVGSTDKACELGDAGWTELLERTTRRCAPSSPGIAASR